MAYDVSALAAYTDEQSEKYLYQLVAEGTSLSLFPNMQPGIKSAEKIKIIASTGVWQAGGSCGFTASGDTAFSERTLTVGKIKVNLSWCPKALEAKYTQLKLKAGSTYEDATFAKEIVDDLQNSDQFNMEQAFWNGDTTSGDQYLMHFDGLRKIIKAGSGVLKTAQSNGEASATTWSEANSRTIVKGFVTKMVSSLPQHLGAKDLRLFMGTAEYYTLKQKYIADNLYHITGDQGVMTVEGTDIPIEPVLGLSGKQELYLMRTSNVYKGTDLANEEEQFEFWYSKDDDLVKYKKEWKFGVQIAFPNEIIYYQSAA